MAQGSIGLNLFSGNLQFGDSANLDAFSRLRVSEPQALFDAQFTYDLNPLLYEQIVAESGASIAHNTQNRNAVMTFSSTPTGGKSYMQSFEYFRYQPGKSQMVAITFNPKGGVANCLKFAGLSDGTNGYEFRMDGTTPKLVILASTGAATQTVSQSSWNLDTMDGNGASGITLDFTKEQILIIDFQALYVGRVRFGFDVNGVLYYAHEFLNANVLANPYIAYANLPVRAGMTCTGTVSTTFEFNCVSVISEGGQEDTAGYPNSAEGAVTAGNGARTHILSIRPLTTFNSLSNRSKFVLDSVDILVTGNSPVKWEMVVGQALTTPSYVSVGTYSAFEYDTAGTVSGSPSYVLQSGYCPATNQAKGSVIARVSTRVPITLDAAGSVRSLGTLSFLVTGIGGTSATRLLANWKEIR